MPSNEIYVLLRSGQDEVRLEGSPEQIIRVLKGLGFDSNNLEIADRGAGSFEVEVKPVDIPATQSSKQETTDFLSFYRKVKPKTQVEQVLVIAYFYQKHQQLESLSLAEYEQAYTLLRRIPVTAPSNLKSSVRNVIDRTQYLRNADRGRYMLTMAGEEFVDAMIAEMSST